MTTTKTPAPVAARPPIAIVGVSAHFPGSQDETGFWRDILAGRDLIREVPPTHWLREDYFDADPTAPDKCYATRGAFLDPVPFDALGFGMPPNIVPATDTSQLLALIVAQRVLDEAARGQFAKLDRERISVILGVTSGQELLASMVSRLQRPVWVKALREAGLAESKVREACDRIASHYVPWQENTFPGLLGNVVAGRIANRFDTGGTNCVTDAACASSFAAISMAVNELYLGQSDLVVTGGVDTLNDIFMYTCFAKTHALSHTGDCRPFSDQADGTLLGEGLAMFALKRLEDAERDGDRIYGLLRGLGASSDGRAKSVYAPRPEGQALALKRAYAAAGYSASTVELLEAHGTGTKAGDVAEFEGLSQAFDASGRTDRQWCALGSVKSQIGHTKATAGAAGLFKVLMSVVDGALPPTLKVARPNPKLGLEKSPFHLNTRPRPWVRGSDHPRRAGVSAFGFGGSNFHLTVEEYVGPNRALRKRVAPAELLVFGAGDAASLRTQLAKVDASAPLAWLARRSQESCPRTATHRLALVATDAKDLAAKLEATSKKLAESPEKPFSMPGVHYALGARQGAVAFLFPGQGSQYVGMGGDLAMAHRDALRAWDLAADVVVDGQTRLQHVVFPPPAFSDAETAAQTARLKRTEWAQPALGAASLAQLNLLARLGLKPDLVGGHSFGELVALHAAGAFDAATMLRIARRRGELMAEAAKAPGAMTAALAPIDAVRRAIEGVAGVVVANHNSPKQVVLSGPVPSIEQAETALKAAELRFERLEVATAFHSPVVSGSVEPFAAFLASQAIAAPSLPTYANTTAAPYAGGAEGLRTTLSQQLGQPVRFVEQVEAMYAAGARLFLEVGSGSVLTGLVDRILAGKDARAIALDAKGKHGVAAFLEGLARLWAAGVVLDHAALWAEFQPVANPADAKKPAVSLPISGANYGKPYPTPESAASYPKPNPEVAPSTTVPATTALAPSAPAPSAAAAPPVVSVQPVAAPALDAFWQAQRETMEAHTAWQKAMTETHQAFLQSVERSLTAIAGVGGSLGVPAALPTPAIAPAVIAPVAALPVAPAPIVAAPVPVIPVAPQAPAPVAAKAVDLKGVLLSVVAEKTGYPAEMLSLELGLEADLGIDSIKRVEILSALRERVPTLPEFEPTAMAALKTLGAVLEFAREKLGGDAVPTAATAASAPAAAQPGAPALKPILLAVVAEKTGYPAEMLSTELSLEADLGIDSIKRVEILSALRERVPTLPEFEPTAMAALKTLGAILEFAGEKLGNQAPAPTAVSTPAAPPLRELLLAVVAEKTGYPAEMLSTELSLEADLGVDSIKRVEILSALRERVPGLPEVDPATMGALKTLGAILQHLDATPVAGQQSATPTPTAQPAAKATQSAPQHLARAVVQAFETSRPGLCTPKLTPLRRVFVTDDGAGVCDALVQALQARGFDAARTEKIPADAEAIVHLGGLRAFSSPAEADAIVRGCFEAARAAAPRLSEKGGLFVSVQDTGGEFGLSGDERAGIAGIAGIVKTAGVEWPRASVRVLDVERGGRAPEAIASSILEELLEGGCDLEVALSASGRRVVIAATEQALTPGDALDLGQDPVVLATGGARGVTAACLVALARDVRARFVLLGRTALTDEPECCRGVTGDAALKRALLSAAGRTLTPAELSRQVREVLSAREVRATMQALEATGSKVRYLAVDARDAAGLTSALEPIRKEWGPITVVVHGAGVIADKRLAEKTDDAFARVWDTKVAGLRALLEATSSDPLKVLALFSSVAARLGNEGQCDYAAANETLNKLAALEALRRPGCRVKSFGWGPWDGGMVDAGLRAHFQATGTALIPLEAGARAFADELLRGDESIELVVGGALPAPAPRTVEFELHVDRASHPQLDDHCIDDVSVLPVVQVIEWFVRAAQSSAPGQHVTACRDLRVLRGVRLDHFRNGGDRLTVRCTPEGALRRLELRGAEGALHYSATVEVGAKPAALAMAPEPPGVLEDFKSPIYGGELFHGPRFQVVRTVDGVSREGLVGTLSGTHERGWGGAWLTDPAALDGGLQLALLWSGHVLGGNALPTSIGAVRTFQPGTPEGPFRAILRGRVVGDSKTTSDITLLDRDGAPVSELRDVETHRRPEPPRA